MRRSANRLATTAGTHAAAGQTTALQFCGPCQYITNESDAEEVCRKILRNNDVKVIGVDAEWNMTYRKNHRQHVALLQFAYEDNSLLARYSWPAEVRKKHASLERKMQVKLFHLRHFAHFPASLRRILEADDILKVGVNVKGDCTRMVRGGFIDVPEGKPAWLDTEKLARRKVLLQQAARLPAEVNLCAAPAIAEPENLQAEQGGEEDASPLSSAAAPAPGGGPRLSDFTLASLCGYFYQGVPLEKERRVRCSNWEQLPLTASQQKYAATDAATHLSTYWALQELEDLPESAIIAAGNRGGRGSGSVGAMRGGAIFNMHAMVARRSPAHCAGAVAENLAEDEIAAGDAAPDTHDAEQEQPASSPPLYFRPRVPQELLAKIAGENQQDAPKLRRIEVEACLDTRMPADFFSADYSGAEREHPSGNKADPAQARPVGEEERRSLSAGSHMMVDDVVGPAPSPTRTILKAPRQTEMRSTSSPSEQSVEAARRLARGRRMLQRADLVTGSAITIAQENESFLTATLGSPPRRARKAKRTPHGQAQADETTAPEGVASPDGVRLVRSLLGVQPTRQKKLRKETFSEEYRQILAEAEDGTPEVEGTTPLKSSPPGAGATAASTVLANGKKFRRKHAVRAGTDALGAGGEEQLASQVQRTRRVDVPAPPASALPALPVGAEDPLDGSHLDERFCVPWESPLPLPRHSFLFVPERANAYSVLVSPSSDATAAASASSSSTSTGATASSSSPGCTHGHVAQIQLPPAVFRAWHRVLQQGYTLGEACRELQLKPATLESYLTKAMISGKEYIWGPHLGVSDETLQVLVDALGSDGRALPSNQTFLENAGLDSTQANLALLHLKRLVDAGSYDEISRAVPALDPKKLEAKLWSIRRAKTWFHFAPRPSKSKNHLQNMAPVQVASSPRAGHVVVPAAI